jgi:hypothetical protein
MNALTDNSEHSQAATLNENKRPFCENDRPFWREYAMFIGSEDSGEIFSILASLAASCKRLAVEPYAYFYDVIKRLTIGNYSELDELLPDRWSKNYAQISA